MSTESHDRESQLGGKLHISMDPARASAILAEAHRMRADVLRRLAGGLFSGPAHALSSVATHVRHLMAGHRPNFS